MGLLIFFAAAAVPGAAGETVLARTDDGAITQADLAREEGFVSPGERRFRKHERFSDSRTVGDWLKRIALRRIAYVVSEKEGLLTEADIREGFRRAGRDWLVKQWAKDCYGYGFKPFDETEARRRLSSRELRLPARIRLSHIFLRAEGEKEERKALRKLERIRGEIRDLEGFRAAALRVSDSLSGRRGGRIGYVRKGWIPDAAWDRLFALEPGTISPPMKLKGGYHIFFLEAKDEDRPMSLDTKLKQMKAAMMHDQEVECRKRRIGEIRGTIPVSRQGGRLQVGGFSVALDRVRSMYGRDLRSGKEDGGEAEEVITKYIEDELLYQAALNSPTVEPKVRERARDMQESYLLGELITRRRGSAMVNPSLEEVMRSYEGIRKGFLKRRQFRLTVMKTRVPKGMDPLLFLDGLKALAASLRVGTATFVDLCSYVDTAGTVEHWPMSDSWLLAKRLGPVPFEEVRKAKADQIVGPFRDGEEIYVIRLDAVIPPRRLTFEEAAPKLRRKLRKEQRRAVTAKFLDELLLHYHYELTEEGRRLVARDGGGEDR